MTTHAAHSHDAFERVEQLRQRLEKACADAEDLARKLESETERTLLLANVLAILRDIPTHNLSEGKRVRLQAVREQVRKALAA